MSDIAEQFRAYAKDDARLSALPYADVAESGNPVNMLAEELSRRTPLAVMRWESNLSDPYFRVLSLDFLAQQPREEAAPTVWEGCTLDEPTLIEGDLVVRGNLENRSNLVVLGDLTVEGAYIGRGEYPCCSVGGSMDATNFYANESETICLGTLTIQSVLLVVYNHTVTIARKLVAKTLISDDADIDGELIAESRHENPSYDIYKELFGLEFDDEDQDLDPGEQIYDRVVAQMLNPASG
ncbi:MAG: hypothetical protein AB8H86_32075 [Polyangiales bacterium]